MDDAPVGKLLLPLVKQYRKYFEGQGYGRGNKRGGRVMKADPDYRFGLLTELATAWDNQRDEDGRRVVRSCASLDAAFIEDWFIENMGHLAPSSRAKYKGWIKMFLQWGITRGYPKWKDALDFNPGKTSNQRENTPVWFPMEFLQDAWEAEPWYWRGMMATLGLCAIRQNELITLRVGSLDMANELIEVNRWKTGDRGDQVQMTEDLVEELTLYLMEYGRQWAKQQETTPLGGINTVDQALAVLDPGFFLFPSLKVWYGRMTHLELFPKRERYKPAKTIAKKLRARMTPSQRAQATRVGTHAFRRSAANALWRMLKEEGDPMAKEMVSDLLGHKNLKTTDQYLNFTGMTEARNEALKGRRLTKKRTDANVIPLRRTAEGS